VIDHCGWRSIVSLSLVTREHGTEPRPGQQHLDRRAAEGLQWARWAVGRWSQFPVDQTPRPIVLADSRVHVEGGFASGEAKMAFMEGRWDLAVEVPGSVLDELARQARSGQPRGGASLRITGIELADSEFLTDRGRQRLPAWRVSAEDTLGPIWVLDPGIADWQPPPAAGGPAPIIQAPGQDPGAQIQAGSDGRSVVVDWLGAVPAFERYLTAEVVETAQAFGIVAIGIDVGPDGPRTLAGHIHKVPALLSEPIGARVYVDLHGHAGQVIRTDAHEQTR
jgi:hypothetical protein